MNENNGNKKASDFGGIDDFASMRHSKNINEAHEKSLSFRDRIADTVANLVGSWGFIISFVVIILLWVGLNSALLFFRHFDPYPFILLNLVLSCVAALQAPVIMMSQKRQEKKDRIRAEYDYEVNLKSEILIEEVLKRLSRLDENQREFLKQLNRREHD